MIDLQPGMDIRIHSYEEERELLQALESLGYTWLSGHRPKELSYFRSGDNVNTVYHLMKYEKKVARRGVPQEAIPNIVDWISDQMQISVESINAFV